MRLPKTGFLLFLFPFFSLLQGCQTTQYLSNKNLEFLYNTSDNEGSPGLHVYHPNRNTSELYVKVPKKHLTFSGNGQNAKARFTINYRIYKNYEYRTLFDSSSMRVTISKKQNGSDFYTGKFNIPDSDQYYLIAVTVIDEIAEKRTQDFIYYRPYKKSHNQNFLVHTYPDSQLHTKSYVNQDQSIKLTPSSITDSLVVKRYARKNFKTAPPPFREDYTNKELYGLAPDSVFLVGKNQVINFNQKGFYTFKAQGGTATISFQVTNPHFPELKHPEQLLKSIRYITSKSNYEDLKEKAPKAAVDRFWLNRANNDKDKAKGMIQRYYNRVQLANRFFTSYKKGWKTDRGITYIVFGKPYIVYRTNKHEVWIYPNKSNFPNLEFRFKRKDHALAPVYYDLKRSRFYEDPFYQGVEQLRNNNAEQ